MCYDDSSKHFGHLFMEKICSKCKKNLPLEMYSKDKYQKSGLRCACKNCSAKEFAKYFVTENYKERLKKYQNQRSELKKDNPISVWVKNVYNRAKKSSKTKGIEFSITKDWLLENVTDVCPLLGIKLDYTRSVVTDQSASLDRKNSFLGYTPENCKVISFKANRIKNNATYEEIEKIAKNMKNYLC